MVLNFMNRFGITFPRGLDAIHTNGMTNVWIVAEGGDIE